MRLEFTPQEVLLHDEGHTKAIGVNYLLRTMLSMDSGVALLPPALRYLHTGTTPVAVFERPPKVLAVGLPHRHAITTTLPWRVYVAWMDDEGVHLSVFFRPTSLSSLDDELYHAPLPSVRVDGQIIAFEGALSTSQWPYQVTDVADHFYPVDEEQAFPLPEELLPIQIAEQDLYKNSDDKWQGALLVLAAATPQEVCQFDWKQSPDAPATVRDALFMHEAVFPTLETYLESQLEKAAALRSEDELYDLKRASALEKLKKSKELKGPVPEEGGYKILPWNETGGDLNVYSWNALVQDIEAGKAEGAPSFKILSDVLAVTLKNTKDPQE